MEVVGKWNPHYYTICLSFFPQKKKENDSEISCWVKNSEDPEETNFGLFNLIIISNILTMWWLIDSIQLINSTQLNVFFLWPKHSNLTYGRDLIYLFPVDKMFFLSINIIKIVQNVKMKISNQIILGLFTIIHNI